MKTLLKSISMVALACIALTSCSGNKSDKEVETSAVNVETSTDNTTSHSESTNDESLNEEGKSTETADNCEEFLKGYEDFMNKYIEIIKKYKSNPTDASLMGEYTSLMGEAGHWAEKTKNCAGDAQLAAKLTAIQMKIANAASGM